jgi:hypothetical protein
LRTEPKGGFCPSQSSWTAAPFPLQAAHARGQQHPSFSTPRTKLLNSMGITSPKLGQHGQHFPQAWTAPAGQHGQQLYTPFQQQITSNSTPLAPNPNLLDSNLDSTCSTCSCWTTLGQQQHSAALDSMDNNSPQGLNRNNTLQH